MSYRSEDEKKLLREFLEWLYARQLLNEPAPQEFEKLVQEFYKPKEI